MKEQKTETRGRPKFIPNIQLQEKVEWLIEKQAYQDAGAIANNFDQVLHDMGHIKDTAEHFTPQMLEDVMTGKKKLSRIEEYRLAEMLGEDANDLGFGF